MREVGCVECSLPPQPLPPSFPPTSKSGLVTDAPPLYEFTQSHAQSRLPRKCDAQSWRLRVFSVEICRTQDVNITSISITVYIGQLHFMHSCLKPKQFVLVPCDAKVKHFSFLSMEAFTNSNSQFRMWSAQIKFPLRRRDEFPLNKNPT